jgi:hypothetical protein
MQLSLVYVKYSPHAENKNLHNPSFGETPRKEATTVHLMLVVSLYLGYNETMNIPIFFWTIRHIKV